MANLPGVRQERFTAEETDVLFRAVKDREGALYGDGRNPSKLALVKRAWEEIATIVSTAGIPRTSHLASGAVRTGRAVRNGQLMREQRKHQGAEDPDPLHAMAALSDRTALSGMRQGINARLDRRCCCCLSGASAQVSKRTTCSCCTPSSSSPNSISVHPLH